MRLKSKVISLALCNADPGNTSLSNAGNADELGTSMAHSGSFVTKKGSFVRFLSLGVPLLVPSRDRASSTELFVVTKATPSSFFIRSFSDTEMFICSEKEDTFMSSLPVNTEPCEWSLVGSPRSTVSIKQAASPFRSILFVNSDIHLDFVSGSQFVIEKGLESPITPVPAISGDQVSAHQRRQTLPPSYFELLKTFPYSPTTIFELYELVLYDQKGARIAITATNFACSHGFSSAHVANLSDSATNMYSFKHNPTVVPAGQSPPAFVDHWFRITLASTVTDISRIEIETFPVNLKDAQIMVKVANVERFSTTIVKSSYGAVVHSKVAGAYLPGLVVHDLDTDRYFKIENNVKVPYANHAAFVLGGFPKYVPFFDSAMANLPESPSPIQAPTTAPTTNTVLVHASAKTMGIGYLRLTEIKVYDSNGVVVVPSSATASSGTVAAVSDRATTEFAFAAQTNLFTHHHFLRLSFPSTVNISRVTLIQIWEEGPGIEVFVQNGLDVSKSDHMSVFALTNFNIVVPIKGKFPHGWYIKSGPSGKMYRIENNQLRFVSQQVWELLGHPVYYVVSNKEILSLTSGTAITEEEVISTQTHYLWYNGNAISDIKILDTANVPLELLAKDITVDMFNKESDILDGSTTTFAYNYGDQYTPSYPGMHFNLTSYQGRVLKSISIASYGARWPAMFELKLRFGDLYYEYNAHKVNRYPSVFNVHTFDVVPAVGPNFFPRPYYASVMASFGGTKTDDLVINCPHKCDFTAGCVAYTITIGQRIGCTLLFNSLVGAVPSKTEKTFIASAFYSNFTFPPAPKPLYESIPSFPPPPANEGPRPQDCLAAHCSNNATCVAQIGYDNRPKACFFVNPNYLRGISSHHITSPVPSTMCQSGLQGYSYYGTTCRKTITPKFVPHYDAAKFVWVQSHAVAHPVVGFNSANLGNMVGKESTFIMHHGCESCSDTYVLESVRQPGKYICVSQAFTVALETLDSGSLCQWKRQGSNIQLARDISEVPYYMFTDPKNGQMIVSTRPRTLVVQGSYRPRLGRPYHPKTQSQVTGGSVIKTVYGVSHSCADECDDTEGCERYEIHELEKGCTFYSSVGTVNPSVTTALHTVRLDLYREDLTDALPWQTAGGKLRKLSTGLGIHIHLIDSGVNYQAGSKGYFDDINLSTSDNAFVDPTGHGSLIESIFRGPAGIVPGASIHNVKIFNATGETTSTKFVQAVMDVLHRASNSFQLNYVTRPTIISVSAVFRSNFPIDCISEVAYNMGAYLVFAAGNNETERYDEWNSMSPAGSRAGIVVGAYDSDFRIRNSKQGRFIDVYGPGCGYTDPKTAQLLGGTSLATPHVAAALAKFLSENPEYLGMAPVYAYRAIKSAAIPGELRNSSGVAEALMLTGATPKIFNNVGDWGVKNVATSVNKAYKHRTCSIGEAQRLASLEVVTGKLVSSAMSASASEEMATDYVNGADFEENFF